MFSSFFQILKYHIYFFLFFQTRLWFEMSIYCEKVGLFPISCKFCLIKVIFVLYFSTSKIGGRFHQFELILVVSHRISLIGNLNRNLLRFLLSFTNVFISCNQLCFLLFVFYKAFPALILFLTSSIKSVLLISSIRYGFVWAFTNLFGQAFIVIF